MRQTLGSAKRVVIKVGSSLLIEPINGELNQTWLDSLLADIIRMHRRGQKIIIVSSGAVAMGKQRLQLSRHSLRLEEAQAAAAIGQVLISQAYQASLATAGINVAQMLLTLADSEDRQRYMNARNTLEKILQYDVIPVINENDSVATSEIRYGDNDRLAARVAQMAMADMLVLLSDIDGLYTADPHHDPKASFINEVHDIDDELRALAGESASNYGSGGMRTKLAAADMVTSFGCEMLITDGKTLNPLSQLEGGARHTVFLAKKSSRSARKDWLRQHLSPQGSLVIDEGAVAALKLGKSLLPAGVMRVTGSFKKGDAVRVIDSQGNELARGLVNYSAHEATGLSGVSSHEFTAILGYCGSEEMIHRNDLAVF